MPREMIAGNLKIKIFDTRLQMGVQAATEAAEVIQKVIAKKGNCNIIFAAAPSQNEFLSALCKQDVDWTKCRAFHMDEYIGLPTDAPQGFGNFLKRGIFDHLPFGQVYLINDCKSVATAAEEYSKLLVEYPPDVVCMGIGENGHIAFNDPHVAKFDDTALVKMVSLDTKCRMQQVNDGCFARLNDVPTHAVTLTIPALTSAQYIFCMVPGILKADAVRATVLEEIKETLPASILRIHKKAVLYLDIDSAKHLL